MIFFHLLQKTPIGHRPDAFLSSNQQCQSTASLYFVWFNCLKINYTQLRSTGNVNFRGVEYKWVRVCEQLFQACYAVASVSPIICWTLWIQHYSWHTTLAVSRCVLTVFWSVAVAPGQPVDTKVSFFMKHKSLPYDLKITVLATYYTNAGWCTFLLIKCRQDRHFLYLGLKTSKAISCYLFSCLHVIRVSFLQKI